MRTQPLRHPFEVEERTRESRGQLELATPPPDLALQVSGGLAEPLEAHASPVHGVQLGQRVDESFADPGSCRRVALESRGQAIADHDPLGALHQVEGDPDDRGVVAGQEGTRRP